MWINIRQLWNHSSAHLLLMLFFSPLVSSCVWETWVECRTAAYTPAPPPSPPQPHQLTSLPPPAQTGCADRDTESSLVLVPLTQERLTPPLPHSLPSPLSHCSPCRQFHSISLLPVSTSVHLAPVIGPQFKSCCSFLTSLEV